jgi:hypothetical protein
LSGAREPSFLDTLGAAYAELGNYPLAARTAQQAAALARQMNNARQADNYAAHEKLYAAGQPLREK